MTKITKAEQRAIVAALHAGAKYGYGNLISHLQTAWAATLMLEGFAERAARKATAKHGDGYPFAMQRDLIERGEWDETGKRYRPPEPKPTKRSTSSPDAEP